MYKTEPLKFVKEARGELDGEVKFHELTSSDMSNVNRYSTAEKI